MKKNNLFLRACIAILLMLIFFALALSIAGAMLYFAFILGSALPGAKGRGIIGIVLLIVAMVVAAGVILWSIIPRIDRFTPPGPELSEDEHPELFEEIRQVAAMTQQEVPAHVYLVPDVNAFVTERGGWMGFGSKRVMGVGLGLMNLLTVTELRAVIAHEFGHFEGGDTKLGPWIYKTRSSIGRTVHNLFTTVDYVSETGLAIPTYLLLGVSKIFEKFAMVYLRITHAISRAQEYSADKIAVTTQGAPALIEGLKKLNRDGLAFDTYINNEFLPLLENNYKAPFGEGFRLFLSAESISTILIEQEKESLAEGQQDPYDTHPPLFERIRHAESLDAPIIAEDPRLAVELLRDLHALEALLFDKVTNGADLKVIGWDNYLEVFLPAWKKTWKESQDTLGKFLTQPTPLTLPRSITAIRLLAAKYFVDINVDIDISATSDHDLHEWAGELCTKALCAMLLDHGYSAFSRPGDPLFFHKDDGPMIHIEKTARLYFLGEMSFEDWSAFWTDLGLANTHIKTTDAEVPIDVPVTTHA